MTFTQLKYFYIAATTGSFSRSAEALGVTQSALSNALLRLEEELGVSLFVHSRGKMELSTDGSHFLESVRSVLLKLEDLEQRTELSFFESNGELTIATFGSSLLISKMLSDFVPSVPNSVLSLVDVNPAQQKNVFSTADFLVCSSAFHEPVPETFEHLPLFDYSYYIVGPPSDKLLSKNLIYLDELSDCDMVLYSSEVYASSEETAIFAAEHYTPHIRLTCSTLEEKVEAVLYGNMYTLVSSPEIDFFTQTKKQLSVLTLGLHSRLMPKCTLYWESTEKLSPIGRYFLAFAKTYFNKYTEINP